MSSVNSIITEASDKEASMQKQNKPKNHLEIELKE